MSSFYHSLAFRDNGGVDESCFWFQRSVRYHAELRGRQGERIGDFPIFRAGKSSKPCKQRATSPFSRCARWKFSCENAERVSVFLAWGFWRSDGSMMINESSMKLVNWLADIGGHGWRAHGCQQKRAMCETSRVAQSRARRNPRKAAPRPARVPSSWLLARWSCRAAPLS